jgi:hypothetical protein
MGLIFRENTISVNTFRTRAMLSSNIRCDNALALILNRFYYLSRNRRRCSVLDGSVARKAIRTSYVARTFSDAICGNEFFKNRHMPDRDSYTPHG